MCIVLKRHCGFLHQRPDGQCPMSPSRPQKAMFHYELAVHFNAQCAEAWNNMGVLHKEEDNLDRAAECYMAALHIRPNFPQVGGCGSVLFHVPDVIQVACLCFCVKL